jgi:transcriptional regulator with XRE-family HTH domain
MKNESKSNIKVKPKLRKIMKDRDITQLKLSELSGVPQGSISRFDEKSRHEASHLFSISKALNLAIEDLFEEVDDK